MTTTIGRYSRTHIRPDLGVETAGIHGWLIADYLDVGRHRLAFTRLLDDMAAGRIIGVIATDPLDLMGRYVADAERLIDVVETITPTPLVIFENSDVDFHTPSGRLMVRMLAVLETVNRDDENRRSAAHRAQAARAINDDTTGGAL